MTVALEVARPPAPEAARLLVPEVARPSAKARVMAHDAPCPRHWKGREPPLALEVARPSRPLALEVAQSPAQEAARPLPLEVAPPSLWS